MGIFIHVRLYHKIKQEKREIKTMRLTMIKRDFDARFNLTKDYWLSQDNHVYEFKNNEFIKLSENTTTNYIIVHLESDTHKSRGVMVHRIVYATRNNVQLQQGSIIHHINGHKRDCRAENLELTTRERNIKMWWHGEEQAAKEQQNIKLKTQAERVTLANGLTITRDGHVFSKHGNEIKVIVNKNSTTNLIVSYYDRDRKKNTSLSYGRLCIEAFMETPKGKWQAMAISRDIEDVLNPLNYYPAVARK